MDMLKARELDQVKETFVN